MTPIAVSTPYGWRSVWPVSEHKLAASSFGINAMKFLATTMILCGCFVYSQGKPIDFESRIGVVDVNENGDICLIIPNKALSNGTQLTLVVFSSPQSVIHARIKEKLGKSCSHNPDTGDASFYSLQIDKSDRYFQTQERQAAALAVVTTERVVVQHGKATADLDYDGRREFFRDCTSNEGVHLTVWSGTPLRGKRRWHFYYYLGYDVVPSCKRKDYM